ncbi:MAG TPA: reverse transcriptase family protein [Terriglobales bacterium]|nr:reverse transcriptase family protein [Terriglobales bacterium]
MGREEKQRDFSTIQTTEDVARLLAVSAPEINHLLAGLAWHYQARPRRKPNGSVRILKVPNPQLRLLQRKINDHILSRVPLLPCVKGGVRGSSPQMNAGIHKKQPVVVSMDLADFFPSVNVSMVRKAFQRLGLGEEAVGLLTRIATFENQLPQGAPTSTPLANLVLEGLDRRIMGLQLRHGFNYSRWVDDLTFSGSPRLLKVRRLIERIVEDEGFHVNHEKTKVMFAGRRQSVTKFTVNTKVNVARERVAAIKKELSSVAKDGAQPSPSTIGRLYWLRSVNDELGETLVKKLKAATPTTFAACDPA